MQIKNELQSELTKQKNLFIYHAELCIKNIDQESTHIQTFLETKKISDTEQQKLFFMVHTQTETIFQTMKTLDKLFAKDIDPTYIQPIQDILSILSKP